MPFKIILTQPKLGSLEINALTGKDLVVVQSVCHIRTPVD